MGLNPITASKNIVEKYLRYIKTTFYIKNSDYMNQFMEHLSNSNHFAKGPYLDFSDSFKKGKSIKELIEEGILSKEFIVLYKNKPSLLKRTLYKHQEVSIRKIIQEKNLVVTTGTGSGKTESFLIPIINYLMKEKELGKLTDGVRALIIYPMNALANDQMKRMRELFANYPDITFGSYTGETEKKDSWAISKYESLNNEKPLTNERISRNQMKERPPHILITNYAMLEYLLLRPDDNVFFHGENARSWKYIILDEAHTYNGATGIEVSMLIRRLKNYLQFNEKIKFILTSATLGDEKDNQEIVEFATNLCADAEFNNDSIVRAYRYYFNKSENRREYPVSIYEKLNTLSEENAPLKKYIEIIEMIDKSFKIKENTVPELLYEFISRDNLYYMARKILQNNPCTIQDIAKKLSISSNDLINFVSVASKAHKDNIMLLDARYHMFIRALEGAYISLGQYKRLSITPQEKVYINGDEYKCYKISVCQYCGQIYIEGIIDKTTSKLIQKRENEQTRKNNHYMLVEENMSDYKEYDDTIDIDEENLYNLCGKCGRIEKVNIVNTHMCDCGKENIVKVLEYSIDNKKSKSKSREIHKCLACGLINTQGSILRGFYIGQEAAASVIGTSLYEEIPSEEIEVIENTYVFDKDDDFFGNSENKTVIRDIIKEKVEKQLLVFSDSRQEAAYFAGYFSFTYNNLLRRRLFIEALKDLREYSDKNGITINAAAQKLAALFEKYSVVEADSSLKEAWKTILYEISSNDRNSLENLCLISFEYQGYNVPQMGIYKGKDVLTIQRVLANSFRRDCMFDFPLSNQMIKADKEYYSYKGLECTMSLKPQESNNIYCKSWLPKSRMNARVDYILRTAAQDKEEAIQFLKNIWIRVFQNRDKINGGLKAKRANEYIMDISKFKIRTSFSNEITWYICDKCGKVTVNNIKNICPAHRCDGVLKVCNVDKEFEDNHYRKQYLKLDIFPMEVKEHTAQLSPETAKKYQEMFIKNEINVLSCSTTFEMGVDVGELETVFMKNMPPTPANYTQRAGRAGRSKSTVAYSLTFCKLSSHDLTYFNNPTKMIRGKINPPKFKTNNKKIAKRHMNAAVIAAFWKENKDYYKDVGTFFDDFNFSNLLKFIENIDDSLKSYINKFIPLSLRKNIDNWLKELISEEGILYKEYYLYKNELSELEKLKKEAIHKSDVGKPVGNDLKKIEYYINKINEERILSFLSKKNIIPKYGFPVDTVELVTSFNGIDIYHDKSSKLRLQRDLMIAISEYAPGSEVIADGDLYRSQYIKRPTGQNKIWSLYDFGICFNPKCGHINIERHISERSSKFPKPCDICGENVIKENTFLIPEYGFIISPKIEKSATKKPIRTYRGEIFYVGDKEEIIENEFKEHKINKDIIKIKSTSNDELVVINTSNFYVCGTCGYTEVADNPNDELFIINKHKNSYGKDCKNQKLFRRTLGHKFKTDVAYISVDGYLGKDKALSIVYALLEGVSQYLGIERNDISGTLHYNKLDAGNWETNFILFDTVPGGAGHVRRIGEADKEHFIEMLKTSLAIVKQCNCGEDSNGDSACYSCLCNYYNQKYHDIIKRRYAIEFFESILTNE